MAVDANKDAVPIMPLDVLKYFLPNNPNKMKVAKESKGMRAMIE